jgi:GT2 family glycosyltransferase
MLREGMSVAAVIVTYNSRGSIAACLDGLLASGVVREVIVVDNASSDGTLDAVRGRDDRIVTIALSNNRGFGAAANIGAARATAPLLAFFNPDASVAAGTCEALAELLERDAAVWAVGPALLNDRGVREYSARGFPSEWSTLFNRRYLDIFPRSRRAELVRFLMLDHDRTAVFECDWLSGAFFLLRRADFAALGGFDEQFFMYYEDADLFRRRPPGRPVLFVGSALAAHAIGGSSRQVAVRAGAWRVRSSWRYYRKHLRRGLGTDARYTAATLCGILLEMISKLWKRA